MLAVYYKGCLILLQAQHFNTQFMLKIFSLVILTLLCNLGFSQSVPVRGQIIVDSLAISGVEVINLNTKQSTASDSNGFFEIHGQEDHLLVFYDKRLDYMRHSISNKDLTTVFIVQMTYKIEELEEVFVNNDSHITAESLGIVPKGLVFPTKEERLIMSSGGGIFTAINAISGKDKELKTALEYARKDRNIAKLASLNLRSYYTKSFGVPIHYHNDFERFLVEDATFLAALKSNQRHRVLFQMARVAVNYNEIMKNNVK